MNRLRMVKEKEVIAAVDAFSHTKSLKSLMEEVHDSTIEVKNKSISIWCCILY